MPLSFSSGANKALGFASISSTIPASGATYSFVPSPFGGAAAVPSTIKETNTGNNDQMFVFYVNGVGAGVRPLYWRIKHITTSVDDFNAQAGIFYSNNWGATAYPSPGSWYNNPYGEELGRFGIELLADNVTEGSETFQIEIRENSFSGPVVLTSSIITVSDTSSSPTGEQEYTTAGTYTWTAPAGVTSVNVVAVGGGGSGTLFYNSGVSKIGGGGGGLGWANGITVTPGNSYVVQVGAASQDSYFISNTTVKGGGGGGGFNGVGGTFVGDGGGNGGSGSVATVFNNQYIGGGGGGGAGGYTGNGGNGGVKRNGSTPDFTYAQNGSGGGGAGGYSNWWGGPSYFGGGNGGGGVGIYGQGLNGTVTTTGFNPEGTGGGGSGGGSGGSTYYGFYGGGTGGGYGGGGGGAHSNNSTDTGKGSSGAVRIIWGSNRAFPSTNTIYGYTPPKYFIAHLSNANGRGVAVASSGNIYTVGNVSAFMLIAKYNSSGTLQWQRSLGEISPAEEGWAIAIDSSENVYITGYSQSNGSSIPSAPYTQFNNAIIVKYNSSGAIQWQKQLSGGTSRNEYGASIAVDSASNVYVSAYSNANAGGGNFDFLTFKLDSSGNMLWQRTLSGTSTSSSDFGITIALDSASNVYVSGYSDNNGTYDLVLAKYNNLGTLQWQRVLGNNYGGSDGGSGVAVDSAGNIYVTGFANGLVILVAKYNSNGAIQWQRSLSGSASLYGNAIAVDSDNNVYITANGNISGTDDIFTAKYDSNGTLQWQRKLSTTASDSSYDIALDSSGSMYTIGITNVSGSTALLLTKFPSDGTLTGTYSLGGSTYTYAASSLTSETSTLADSIGSLSGATSSLTLSDIQLTDAAGTGTPTVIIL